MRGKSRAAAFLLASPFLLFLSILVIWPTYLGVKTALSRDLLSEFEITPAGLENFKMVLEQPQFWEALRFTIIFALAVTIFECLLGFALALVFDRKFPGKTFLFSVTLVPIMIAPSLMAVMYRLILNENIGIVPGILQKFGIEISIFDQRYIFWTLVTLDALQYTSFAFLLIYAALQNMPSEVYESAAIDGASGRQIIAKITIPILKPAIAIIAMLRLIDSFRTFDTIYIMTGGGPGTSTQTIGIHIYKTAFITGDFGMASAMSVLLVMLLAPFMPFIIRQFRLDVK
ncbi:MAG: carbohydrate ABC transporter permease [Actinomycetota bacterium]|jgi:multiple sugar transport system permease protein